MAEFSFNNIDYIECGTHEVVFEIIEEKLVFSDRRKELIDKLEEFLKELYCKNDLIEVVYILGSFASKKVKPSDIDLAIKLNEENIDSSVYSSLLFKKEEIKEKFNIHLVFIELTNKNLEKYIPISKFFNQELNDFRSLTFEESTKIDRQKWNPDWDINKKSKGILSINLDTFCV